MDVEKLAKELILKNMTPEQQMAVLEGIKSTVAEAKEVQKRKIGENVDLVVQALKKIEADIRSRYDDVGNAIEKRVASIKDGRDGKDGKDGRDGKDGKAGRDGAKGDKGDAGRDGRDGVDGVDGVSVTSARIDFDGSLIIVLSSGVELNVGEVVAPDLAERIKVITNGGGTAQFVLDTLASLQTQINNLIPSQTGNSGKFLTTNGSALSWASVAGNLSYQGTWDASTNTPTLASSTGTNGSYYIVATAGSTNLNGITDWQVGDWLLFNGTVWQKIDQSETLQTITSTDGSITVNTVGSNVDLSATLATSATNVIVYVRNNTGATLTKGTAVYINGATGQNPTVTKAQANTDASSAQTLGLMSADLANNSNGYVTVIGLITNIDTSAYSDGDQLYLSGTTAGGLTATKPYAPTHLVYVAVVEHAHPTQGKLFVKVQNGYEMDELHNVSAQSPSNGQTLVYNTSTSLWETSNTFTSAKIISVTDNTNAALRITQLGTGNALLVEDSANPDSTPFVISGAGATVVGYTTTVATANYANTGITPSLEVQGNSASTSAVGLYNWSTSSASSSTLAFSKSVSGTIGTVGAISASGTDLGNIVFLGDDGTNFIPAASILAELDGTPGTNDMPGRLVFSTTADGASTPTERMRISSTGQVTFTAANMLSANPSAFIFNSTGKAAQTGNTVGVISSVSTDATYVGTDIISMYANQGTLTVAPTNQYGFYVPSGFNGATNNYGFYSNIASAAGRWNFYANGTANNYFAGNVGIGTSSPRAKLSVTNGTENTSGDAPQEAIITGANQAITTGLGILTVQSNTAIGADVGATIALGGRIRSTGTTTDASNFAVIKGAKENATSDNSAGYFAISTKPNGVVPVERMRIDSSGNVLVTSAAGLGYGTGSGGTVTQATSKTTGVTLNKPTGQITMNNAALAAGASVTFSFTNSLMTATDNMIATHSTAGGTAGAYAIQAITAGAGAANIRVTNISGGSLSEALVINFAIIKGATS